MDSIFQMSCRLFQKRAIDRWDKSQQIMALAGITITYIKFTKNW